MKKATPLGESGGAVGLEILSAVEGALIVEMVEDGSVDGSELLQCSHPPAAKHCPFPPSERLVRILRTVVGPAASFLPVADTKFIEGSP